MCKILVMSGIKNDPKVQDKAWKFVFAMSALMSKSNSDGLGYTVVDHEGNMFGERWHRNADAFSKRPQPVEKEGEVVVEKYKGFLSSPKTTGLKYNYFGDVIERFSAITLHTRMATSGREFINTHPFVHGDTSLIHNGVIYNSASLPQGYSTCDSEVILTQYLDEKVNLAIDNIEDVAKKLSGYYACAVFSRDKDNKRILDVFKDERASLSAAYIKEFSGLVISTSLSDITTAAEECGLTIVSTFDVQAGVILRINPVTGEAIDSRKFDTTGAKHSWSSSYNSSNQVNKNWGNYYRKRDGKSATFDDDHDPMVGNDKKKEMGSLENAEFIRGLNKKDFRKYRKIYIEELEKQGIAKDVIASRVQELTQLKFNPQYKKKVDMTQPITEAEWMKLSDDDAPSTHSISKEELDDLLASGVCTTDDFYQDPQGNYNLIDTKDYYYGGDV